MQQCCSAMPHEIVFLRSKQVPAQRLLKFYLITCAGSFELPATPPPNRHPGKRDEVIQRTVVVAISETSFKQGGTTQTL